MRHRKSGLAAWLGLVMLAGAVGVAQEQGGTAADAAKWRKAYADSLMKPNGWMSLVALEWLKDGDTTVGSASDNKIVLKHVPAHVGALRLAGGKVELVPAAGVDGVMLDGKPAVRGIVQSDDTEHPSEIVSGDVRMTVIHRGDRFYLRVKDALSPTRRHFHGLSWYAYDPHFRVTAKWVPNATPKTLKIMNVLGQISPEPTPGYAEFTIGGQVVRLEPTEEDGGLFFDFRDTTSKTTTDGAGRFLDTGLPSAGLHSAGTLVIDFNYAHNPPCGYTPYATCPLPTEENRLKVAIPAGEKRYAEE